MSKAAARGSSDQLSSRVELPVMPTTSAALGGRHMRRGFLQVMVASVVGTAAFRGCLPAGHELRLQSRVRLAGTSCRPMKIGTPRPVAAVELAAA